MSKDSALRFKDFEYEFEMFTKITWNGEVIYNEKDALEGECKRVDEIYGDRLIYEMKVNVVDFHHVELDIVGETFEHAQLLTDCEKEYKEVQKYIEEMKWKYSNIGCFTQVELEKKFEDSYSTTFFTPCLDFGYDLEGNISVEPYILAHYSYSFDDKEDPIYKDTINTQLACYNYALEEAKRVKEKFKYINITEAKE